MRHLLIIIVFFLQFNSYGKIIYVNPNSSGSNDGSSWNNAYTSLITAVTNAQPSDELWLTYNASYEPWAAGFQPPIALKNKMKLYGGFMGSETSRSQRGSGRTMIDAKNCLTSCFTASGLDSVVIDAIYITNSNNSYYSFLSIDNSNVAINYCYFYNGYSNNNTGGAINIQNNSNVIVTNTVFTKNGTRSNGGAVNVLQSKASFISCDFIGNKAEQTGGGINSENYSIVKTYNCTFYSNSATYNGGGAYNIEAVNCIFWKNQASIGYPQLAGVVSNSIVQNGYQNSSFVMEADPQFSDADGADNIPGNLDDVLTLQTSSPAINVGTLDTLGWKMPLKDMDNTPRVNHGGIDLGAHECLYKQSNHGVIYVNTAATGLNNGTSWTNAYANLYLAIAAAIPGDEIWVAKGQYPLATSASTDFYNIKQGIKLYGGFKGTENSIAIRDTASNPTVLMGDPNSSVVIKATGLYLPTLIDGFKITNGTSSGIEVNNRSNISFNNCIFGNKSTLKVTYSSPTISNSIFLNNAGGIDGYSGSRITVKSSEFRSGSGGLYVTDSSTFNVTNCQFLKASPIHLSNYSYFTVPSIFQNCDFDNLGGISVGLGSVQIVNSDFTNNSICLVLNNGKCLLSNCSIQNNNSISSNDEAIETSYSQLEINGCSFKNNNFYNSIVQSKGGSIKLVNTLFLNNTYKAQQAGVISASFTNVEINNCKFISNKFSGESGVGAAVNVYSQSKLTIRNSLFIKNEAYQGGAVAVSDRTILNVFNSTFSKNNGTSIYLASGAIMLSSPDSLATIKNSIFWYNTPSGIFLPYKQPFIFENNIINNATLGTNTISQDPLFINPAGLDGTDGTEDDNYRIGENSPALNSGTADTTGLGLPTIDLNGYKRIIATVIDRGAYEYQCLEPVATPVISRFSNDSLQSSIKGEIYYWLYNNTLLQESSSGKIKAEQEGEYKLYVQDRGCLSDTSTAYQYSITSLIENKDTNISIYPNPNNGRFEIRMNTSSSEEFNVIIKDMLGTEIHREKMISSALDIQSKNLHSGTYLLIIENNKEQIIKKIIVQ